MVKHSIDFHIHTAPDPYKERSNDALDAAEQAVEAGMRAIVIKSHHYPTAPVASAAQKSVRDAIRVIGSLALNESVGGVNAAAVEASARMGAKVLWMPTTSSLRHCRKAGKQGGISIIDKNGELKEPIYKVLEVVKKYNLALCTGHISVEESWKLLEAAGFLAIEKFILTHPFTEAVGDPIGLDIQTRFAQRGAYIEHCFVATMPKHGNLDPAVIVRAIRCVGAERCILSTDMGQKHNPVPAEGMRMLVDTMLNSGLTEEELELLIKKNPALMLDID